MASKFHANVSFDNVKEGLVTSADAAAIPLNALAEAINVDITQAGTISTRDIVFNLIGEQDDSVGEVLEIHQSGVTDITGLSEDQIACNENGLGKRGGKPSNLQGADGEPKLAFLVSRALDAGGTRIDSLKPNMTWQKGIYTMNGQYHHEMVDELGRTYVANNETALKYIAIYQGNGKDSAGGSNPINPADYDFKYSVGEPTCKSEFEVGAQATTVVTSTPSIVPDAYDGSIVIGQGLIACDTVWNALMEYIRLHKPWSWKATYLIQNGNWDSVDPPDDEHTNIKGYIDFEGLATADSLPSDTEIRARAKNKWGDLDESKILYQLTSHQREDMSGKARIWFYIQPINEGQCVSPGVDQSEFMIDNLSVQDDCDRTIFFKESPHPPPVGKFAHVAIKFVVDGQTFWYCPNWCCQPEAKLAEGIKGNLLAIDNNRLLISDGVKVNYSATGLYDGWETGNPRYLGNFFPKGIYRLGTDAGIIDFPRDGYTISALVSYENDLYAHRGGSIWKIIQSEGIASADGPGTAFLDRQRINSLGSANFVRSALDGDDFQFWVSSRNSTMVAYGLYPTLLAPSSKVVSLKVDGTMRELDLSRAALLRWGDLVLMSAKKLDTKECSDTPKPMFGVKKEQVRNNVTMVYNKQLDLWVEYDRGVSMFYAGKDGNAYAGGYDGEVWRLDKGGAFDDGIIKPDGLIDTSKGSSISTYIKWKNADFGTPNLPKNLMGLWVEGWIGSGSKVELGVILDQTETYNISMDVPEMVSQCADACTDLRGKFNSQYFSVYLELPADTLFLRLQPYAKREDGYLEIVSVTPVLPQKEVENDLEMALKTGTAVTVCLHNNR
jgi:hypothetical protein